MLTRKNKVCHTCSTEYKFCTGCAEYDHLPRWMALFHNDNCRVIFNTISSYNVGSITKEEAAKILESCDLSYKNEMKASIISKIDEILEIKKLEKSEDGEVISELKDETEEIFAYEEKTSAAITWAPLEAIKRTDIGDTFTGEEVAPRKRPAKMRSKKQVEE